MLLFLCLTRFKERNTPSFVHSVSHNLADVLLLKLIFMSCYPLIYLFNSDCTVRVPFVIAPAFRSASFQSPLEVRGLGLQSNFRSDKRKWGVGREKSLPVKQREQKCHREIKNMPLRNKKNVFVSTPIQKKNRLLCLGASYRKDF